MSLLNLILIGYSIFAIIISLLVMILLFLEKTKPLKMRSPFIYLLIFGTAFCLFILELEHTHIKCENKLCSLHKIFQKDISFSLENKPYVQCELPTNNNSGLDLMLHNAGENPIFIGNNKISLCEKESLKFNKYFFSNSDTPFSRGFTNNSRFNELLLITSLIYFFTTISLLLPNILRWVFGIFGNIESDTDNTDNHKNDFYG